MSDRSPTEVGQKLEAAVGRLGGTSLEGQELFDLYEQLAIQILDSEHQDFEPGELQRYLTAYLDSVREQLGLSD